MGIYYVYLPELFVSVLHSQVKKRKNSAERIIMYTANEKRYEKMVYNRCGKSGLKLPAVSLGLWLNFGYKDNFANMENMFHTAFDLGINHFDLANNYGNPYNGSAVENFGKILDRGLRVYRDELCISTKAGYEMWPGPYGDKNGSRKYLTASLDQSLIRMKLDYVDIFYHHVFDPNTPVEETALALDHTVRQGKALYIGISNYNSQQTSDIMAIFKELRTPFVINQPSYSMLNRWIEKDKLNDFAVQEGFGLAVFSPLYQGLLTDRYLNGIPADSRIGKGITWIKNELNDAMVAKLNKLNEIAKARGQKLSQMALSWVLRDGKVTTVLIGASSPAQIEDNVEAVYKMKFTEDELTAIEEVLRG
jgi:L-glyceraldehyde 3-phosphate reductase